MQVNANNKEYNLIIKQMYYNTQHINNRQSNHRTNNYWRDMATFLWSLLPFSADKVPQLITDWTPRPHRGVYVDWCGQVSSIVHCKRLKYTQALVKRNQNPHQPAIKFHSCDLSKGDGKIVMQWQIPPLRMCGSVSYSHLILVTLWYNWATYLQN